MNKEKLKQIFSLENLSANLQRSLQRFPVALFMLAALTALISVAVVKEDLTRLQCTLVFFLSVGMVLDFAISLWGDEQTDRKRYYIVKCALLTIWTAYCVWLYYYRGEICKPFIIANCAWIPMLVLCIPFVSFWREKNDVQGWHFSISLCKALLISGIVTGVMEGGINGLIFGTAALFDFEPNNKAVIVTNIVCSLLLSGLLFFNLVPAGERKHDSSTDMPRFLINVVKWLLLPLLACYMLVLYVYCGTIILKWELPKGMISWLVSAVMAGYILAYTTLYPQLLDAKSWLTKFFTRWVPALILPLLLLMTVGIVRRFSDYGLTAPRLYLVTLLVWYYAVCILIIALPRKRLHWIFLSVAALFLLSSGHPLNYYRISEKVIKSKVEKMLAVGTDQLTEEQMADLREQMRYLCSTYGQESVEAYHPDSILGDDYYYCCYYERKQDLDSTWNINYHYWKTLRCPRGQFETFKTRDIYQRQAATVTDGILTVSIVLNDDKHPETLLLDTAKIRQASRDTTQLFIPSRSGKYVYVPSIIEIEPEPNDSIHLRIDGYLFGK